MAVAALVIGAVELIATIGVVIALVVATRAIAPLPSDVPTPQDVTARRLVVGNCVAELPPDGDVDTVRVVPCADKHAALVGGSTRLTDDTWPGQTAVDREVAATCVLTDSQRTAGASLRAWSPTEQGWQVGDRTGLCFVVGG